MAAPEKRPLVKDGFSIATGGPIYRALERLGSFRRWHKWAQCVFWTAITWLPLLALSIQEGTAWGNQVKIPLLSDPSLFARFFVALPLLVSAEVVIGRFTRDAVSTFTFSGIISREDLPLFRTALERITRLRDSAAVEIVLVVLACIPFYLLFADYEWVSNGVSSWHGTTSQGLRPAAWWFTYVSSPVLRFFMLRWLWRYTLWSYLLVRISRLNLMLVPNHPDRLGGLAFLVRSQQQFGIVAMAMSSVIAGQFANEILYFGQTFNTIRAPAAVFVGIAVFTVLSPLTCFSSKLFFARYEALRRNSRIARNIAGRFDVKWTRGIGAMPETMIGSQDPSSMIDYVSTYDVVRETRIIPINKRALLYVAVLAALPFASLWLLNKPLERLIAEVLKRLLE